MTNLLWYVHVLVSYLTQVTIMCVYSTVGKHVKNMLSLLSRLKLMRR